LTYDFEVYNNGVLTAALSGVPAGSGTTAITLTHALADNSAYNWRARAFDGSGYGPWMTMATFSTHILQDSLPVEIKFEPQSLNKGSQGNWVKVEIELPPGYQTSDIDLASIRLQGVVPIEPWPVIVQGKRVTVRFKRSDVIAVLPAGNDVPVHVTGKVGPVQFEGVDLIKVLEH
ncbi:MAG TPA: hypothetical protein DEB35_10900, partial [Desulfuromonas sp.]|nr:hypothetical protein [Desulfuromonas sp.]